jgi:hypothetical protein
MSTIDANQKVLQIKGERERFTEIERKEVKEKEFLSVMLELSQ